MKKALGFALGALLGTGSVVVAAEQQDMPMKHHTMSTEDMVKHMKQMDSMMMDSLGNADEGYDARFATLMIAHHEGGIKMAEDALKDAKSEDVKKMARKMIDDQRKDIEKLRKVEAGQQK